MQQSDSQLHHQLHDFKSASGCGGKDKEPHPLLVLLQSIASHITDRAIPAPCGQNKDTLIGSGEEHLNLINPALGTGMKIFM